MTDGYVYAIEREDSSYCFKLFPNNSRHQCIGTSGLYKDIEECKKGLRNFKTMLRQDKVSNQYNRHLKIEQIEGKYQFVFYDNKNHVIFMRDRLYDKRINCENAVKQIFENIDCEYLIL